MLPLWPPIAQGSELIRPQATLPGSQEVTLAHDDDKKEEDTKMAKLQVSKNGQVGIRSMLENGLVHNYVLNDDKAKKIMISNAALPPLAAFQLLE